MDTPAPMDGNEFFARYEAALAGLLQVSDRLESELSSARDSREAALSSAAASVDSEDERLAKLRRTMLTRYRASAEALQATNVLIPVHVRPAAGQSGDANSLSTAIKAQQKAEEAVALELQAVANALKQQATDDQARATAGHEATEALKKRQEQLRKIRQEAERRRGEEERAKRSRQLLIGGGSAVLVLLVVVVLLLNP
ncbi:hypothetical protein [Kocuria atrinae]|uniref:Uncharacterized protein n=1 Tax=Kocuria atrinae TaxID=592377 RepID=A0ABN2XZI2_9MICC